MTAPNDWPPEAREAVARALCAGEGFDPDYKPPHLPTAAPRWTSYAELADDALAALAPWVAAREKAAYQAGWNDREADLLAGIDRVYGTESKP